MKFAITLSTAEPETAFNALRLGNFAGTQGDVGGAGVQMPRVGAKLTEAELATVAAWIDAGAAE